MENTEIKIVLGSAFGDEGKGVTVQYLCKKAIDEGKKPLVIRFSGGPQAAHTVNYNNIEHICSSYGSGVLLGVPTLIWKTAYFDPISAKNEYEVLKTKMENVPPLYVMPKTPFITPYEVFCGRNDMKIIKDGTCGRGIYPTFKREKEGFHINGENFLESTTLEELELYYYSNNETTDYSPEGELYRKMVDDNIGYSDIFSITSGGLLLSFFNVLIFEGSQGLLLDMERGFFPHVTPSKVGLNAFINDKFLEKSLYNAEVYFVTRTYLTRHGNGYEPNKIGFNFDLTNKHETNVYNEFQGNFKTGILNLDLLNEAFNRHCIDNFWCQYNLNLNLVVTHWDLLDNIDEFNYIYNRKREKITENIHENVCELFKYFPLTVKFDNLYINDSIESNLKKIDMSITND